MPAVVLQPLNLGELLDRMFSLYRKNFLLFFGIMLLPSVLAMVVGVITALFRSPLIAPKTGSPAMIKTVAVTAIGGFALVMIAYWIVYSVALGASTFAVGDVYLGRSATIGASYRRIRGRVRRLLWLIVLVGLRIVGVFVVLSMGFGLLMVPLATLGRGVAAGVLAGLGTVMLVFAAIAVMFWLMLRYSISIPSLVLEDVPPRQAIRRSVQLMKGNYLRCFLLLLLTSIIAYVSLIVFQGPFYVAILMTAQHGQPAVWLLSLSSVSGALGQALSAPLIMIGLVLLYYDIRVRKEAFDLQLMMSLVDQGGTQPASAASAAAPSV